MSKKTYVIEKSDGWTTHAAQAHEEGVVYDGVDSIPVERQEIQVQQADGSVVTRGRNRKPNATIGLDSQDVHMGGDRVVVMREERQASGDINMVVQRYRDDGRSNGTYIVPWHLTSNGSHRKGTPRRIHEA
jgi:hypothetical protein